MDSPRARRATLARRWLPCLAGALLALVIVPSQAAAQTTRTEIHVPLRILDNLCANDEPVQLSGDEYITTTTTARSDGGYTVRASIVAPNLKGTGMLTGIPYRGVDGQTTYSYAAPAPFPAVDDVTLYTVLKPQYQLPSMYLVTVIRETIAFDGTPLTTFRSISLTCKQPTCSHHRVS
jgi:hypothetical protein